ncbi:carbohydrate-binding module family 50 protein [Sodiomyces alcalophilus JCM 7366]|uniref:carbohydrate-binding module family 50 protein n=1 Tax=Sodiomyces alcalophilus JCM 7366 TaxID=591952 RepID=UPI0039B67594
MLIRSTLILAAVLVTAPRASVAQVYLANITAPIAGLSSTCIQVLNQQVACDPRILEIEPNRYEPNSVVTAVCTSTCAAALDTYQRRVQGACGNSRYDGGDGWMYLATYNLQIVLESYRGFCLRDSQSNLCNTVIRDSVYGIDPENYQVTATPASTVFCNDCFLSSMKFQLEQPLGAEPAFETVFSSLTSSCGSSGFAVTTPASTTWATRATSAPAPPECDGTEYTLQSGDTCQSVSLAQGINTNQLLAANNLVAYCRNFPTSGKICIPSRHKCAPYQLEAGDHCRNLALSNQITWTQVVTWNPDVGLFCENIEALASDGFVVCLSTPGGGWEHPLPELEPEPEEPITTATAIRPSPTRDALLPNLGHLDPLADGTRNDCFQYAVAPVVLSSINSTLTSVCDEVAEAYGVSEADLTEWNPDLLATPGEDFPCQLRAGFRYCVQDEKVRASTLTPYCVRETTGLPGWYCEDLLNLLDVPLARFAEWNPDVGASCQNYEFSHTYCTAVQGFRPAGQISTCNRWATATDVDPDNDPCGQIEQEYGLQHARFVAWNPSLQQDCSGIVEGYEYCVGTPSFPPPSG